MSGTASSREKRAALGALAADPQTASSPELMSGLVAGLLDGRPRSWSAQSDRSLPRSTRSNVDSPSRPKVATTFASDSRRVEARGRVTVHPPRPAGPRTSAPSRGPTALSLIRPLAAHSPDAGVSTSSQGVERPDSRSETDSSSRTGNSRSSSSSSSSSSNTRAEGSGMRSQKRGGSIGSRLPQDMASAPPSPRTQLAHDVAVAATPSGAARPSSLWSKLSRLSLDSGPRKTAVDHLKDAGSRKSAPHVAPPSADNAGSRWRGWWPAAPGQSSNTTAASSDTAGDSVAGSPAEAGAEVGAETGAMAEADAGVDAAVAGGAGHADAAMLQDGESSLPEHNQPQRKSMLLPDFDPGGNSFPIHALPGADGMGTECADSVSTTGASADVAAAGTHKSTHELEDATNESPLRKRLRTVGKMVVDSAIDMAPAWARTALWGQRVADDLGQLGAPGHESDASSTASHAKELLDASAGRLGKIAVIGVHGWFPMRMLQMLAGEPTGKSEKFCLMMREALKAYLLESHGVTVTDDDITLFPLIGEGRIEDRVELLLSQITDSEAPEALEAPGAGPKAETRSEPEAAQLGKDSATGPSGKQSQVLAEALMPARGRRAQALQSADTVFVVTHSQGTPVSAMMVERLFEMGLLDTARQRVAMLAMAGISHGPLPHLKDNVVIKYIESETARELFELMDPSSHQSQRYVAALSTVLHKGVRLVCIGSWVDEVVPLYSAILQGVSHPNVYRAVYIDAPHYLDDFLTNLIIFALRLRNMGVYDHDLLIHLSEVVAGSLWGHWGHSTVYGEPAVYKLALKWLLYSTSAASQASASASVPTGVIRLPGSQPGARASVSGPQTHMSYRPFNATHPLNPFYIPWIMRTLWDEPAVRNNAELRAELERLVGLFDKWEPKTKVGRDLKYRLEPVRAAL